MKHLSITTIVSIIIALTGRSQTIDTAYANGSGGNSYAASYYKAVAKIVPMLVKFNDTDSVTHLAIRSVNDDLVGSVTFRWFLMDDKYIIHLAAEVQMTGADYVAWDGTAVQALTYVGNKIGGIVFK